MHKPTTETELPARGQWLRCWSALPAQQAERLAASLRERYRVEAVQPASAGLALLPWRDGALGEAFHLGEIPLSRAWVRLHAIDGGQCEGAALLMDDRLGLTRALAVLDAVTAAGWPGADEARALLREGQQALAAADAQRRSLLAQTRVNFATMGSAEDDDAH